jgi:cell division ATPase FtsA
VAKDRAREAPAGPRVSGVELAAGVVRAIVARAEGGRLRVLGRGEAALARDTVAGGLVVDRPAVTAAVMTALGAAERGVPTERTVVAIDGDDVRTYHVTTPFEREESATPIVRAEVDRAIREAREDAAKYAQREVEDDPALRGVGTARITDDVAALVLDGRPLESLVGYHGRALEVHTDVAVAPLVLSGAALATLASSRRRATAVPGIYALSRLVAESGIADAGIVRLGADTTAVALVRERRVVGTRVFGLGRDAFALRDETRDDDARVWAECVAVPMPQHDAPPPERWLFIGVPETLIALPNALGTILSEARGESARIGPLSPGVVGRVFADVPLSGEDLVAAGAAAIAAGVYA